MNRTRLYWILQILGWSGYALINLFFVSLDRRITPVQIGAYSSLAAFYFLSTHAFRYAIKKYGWLNINFTKLLSNTLLTLGVLSILNTIAQTLLPLRKI